MIESTYTAYGRNGETIKAGIVTHEEDKENDRRGPINFLDAVVADVGEEIFEEQVFGIKD